MSFREHFSWSIFFTAGLVIVQSNLAHNELIESWISMNSVEVIAPQISTMMAIPSFVPIVTRTRNAVSTQLTFPIWIFALLINFVPLCMDQLAWHQKRRLALTNGFSTFYLVPWGLWILILPWTFFAIVMDMPGSQMISYENNFLLTRFQLWGKKVRMTSQQLPKVYTTTAYIHHGWSIVSWKCQTPLVLLKGITSPQLQSITDFQRIQTLQEKKTVKSWGGKSYCNHI